MTLLPWQAFDAFPPGPPQGGYGYRAGGRLYPCTLEELMRRCERDQLAPIHLVWTPDRERMAPPAEVPELAPALSRRRRRTAREAVAMGALSTVLWGFLALRLWEPGDPRRQWPLLMVLMLGLLPLAQGLWSLRQLRRDEARVYAQELARARQEAWLATRRVMLTWVVSGSVVAVFALQMIVGLSGGLATSIDAAALVKPAVRAGEVWRMLTGPLLHGSALHLLFNVVALHILGRMIEALTHWTLLALVFLAGVVVGSVGSVLLLEATSVGASGGVMALIGFLMILGLRRWRLMPRNLVRRLLASVILIFAIGLLARDLIDNAAHAGGLLAGLFCGLAWTSRGDGLPPPPGPIVRAAGALAAAVILGSAAATVALLWRAW